jgi:hypothetical protein
MLVLVVGVSVNLDLERIVTCDADRHTGLVLCLLIYQSFCMSFVLFGGDA